MPLPILKSMNFGERIEIKGIAIFEELNPEEMSVIEAEAKYAHLPARSLLMREGEIGNEVFFVMSGHLEVVKKTEEGITTVIATMGPGESIGELSLIDSQPRSATIRASIDSELAVLDRAHFLNIIAQHPTIGIKVYRGIAMMLSKNIRRTSDSLMHFVSLHT